MEYESTYDNNFSQNWSSLLFDLMQGITREFCQLLCDTLFEQSLFGNSDLLILQASGMTDKFIVGNTVTLKLGLESSQSE